MAVSKAEQIRQLFDNKKTPAEIRDVLGISYNHAYNVITAYKKSIAINVQRNPLADQSRSVEVAGDKQGSAFKGSVGTGMLSRMNYQVRRGLNELFLNRDLTREQWKEVKSFFNNSCAFCGKPDTGDSRNGLVPDHLIAAADLGDYSLGNAVSSCHDCNDRRGKKSWEAWLRKNFGLAAQARINKINEYRVKYPYEAPRGPESRLSEPELIEFYYILHDWNEIWVRTLQLRDQINIRKRIGSNIDLGR